MDKTTPDTHAEPKIGGNRSTGMIDVVIQIHKPKTLMPLLNPVGRVKHSNTVTVFGSPHRGAFVNAALVSSTEERKVATFRGVHHEDP